MQPLICDLLTSIAQADGRTLYVYLKGVNNQPRVTDTMSRHQPQIEPSAQLDVPIDDGVMEVDENAESREAENRRREERRGRDNHRDPEAFPTGPKNPAPQTNDYYARAPRYDHRDGGYGYGGGGSRARGPDNYGGPRYRDDSYRGRRGGQSYRP